MPDLLSKSSYFFAAIGFSQLLLEQNGWDKENFSKWIFTPGMLFQSMDKWWGDFGRRTIPHEGLDLCLYEDHKGEYRHLGETTEIPVMFDCRVVNIINDFLGKTIMMEHAVPDENGDLFLSIYGHAKIKTPLHVNDTLQRGDIVCTVSEPTKTKILPHLHVTMAKVSPGLAYKNLNWDTLPKSNYLSLTDPLIALNGPYDIRPTTELLKCH